MDLIKALTNKDYEWLYGLIFSFDESNPVESVNFFETELLSILKPKNNLTLVLSRKAFKAITAQSSQVHYAGVYYNIQAVDVIGGGVFHPKFYLLVAKHAIHFVVGSCNLTQSGLKRNVESFTEVTIDEKKLTVSDSFIISDIKNFLNECFLSENKLLSGISLGLKRTISEILECEIFKNIDTHTLKRNENREVYFLSSIHQSLQSQICKIVNDPMKKIEIISPFYDKKLSSFEQITSICGDVKFYVPKLGNTFPATAFKKNQQLWERFNFYSISCLETGIDRFIHAKYYRFVTSIGSWSFITSANFTLPGFFGGEVGEVENITFKNFEIGILYKSSSNSDLSIENQFDIHHVSCPLELQSLSESDETVTDDSHTTIEYISSAFYDGKKIIVECKNNEEIDQICIELFINQRLIEKHELNFKTNPPSIHPQMVFEDQDSIRIRIQSEQQPNPNVFIIVGRERHGSNNIPSLTGSAFERCIDIGGDDGLDEAFRLAKASGREDWLFYLLTHWPLDRIFIGRKVFEEDQDVGLIKIPNFKDSKQRSYELSSLRDNINHLQDKERLWKNIQSFCEQVDTLNESESKVLDRYTKYCLPVFVEFAFYNTSLLNREEIKKQKNPQIKYPQYKWLKYCNIYSPQAKFMFNKVIKLVRFASSIKLKDNMIDPEFWIWIWAIIKLHSNNTLTSLLQDDVKLIENLINVLTYTREMAEKVYCQANQEEADEYEKVLFNYNFEVGFD